MDNVIDWKQIDTKIYWLNKHPLISGQAIVCPQDLLVFMEHHVYAVWDFMCLAKSLQGLLTPTDSIWVPRYSGTIRRWINEIILGEESDVTTSDGTYSSHYETYLRSIEQLGGDTSNQKQWIKDVTEKGFREAVKTAEYVPYSSRKFMSHTFDIIETNEPCALAASLAFGRETVLATQFQNILEQIEFVDLDCKDFKWYLQRHVDVDGGEHGPASKRLIEELVGNDPDKGRIATEAAIKSIDARLEFWNGVSARWNLI